MFDLTLSITFFGLFIFFRLVYVLLFVVYGFYEFGMNFSSLRFSIRGFW